MPLAYDHDFHIHSHLSVCSGNPAQTTEAMLRYAEKEGLSTLCLTDHFWDHDCPMYEYSDFYGVQNFEHICENLPLPAADGVRFLFGCETEMGRDGVIGVSPEHYDFFDFIIVPTTHFHMKGLATADEDLATASARAATWVRRFEFLLNSDLPLRKVGLAHPLCSLIAPGDREARLATLDAVPDRDYAALFGEAAARGMGIELNADDCRCSPEEEERLWRPFFLAKEAGCRFYYGSDSHSPAGFGNLRPLFEHAAAVLGLEEKDRYLIP